MSSSMLTHAELPAGTISLNVSDIRCAACTLKIERAVDRLPGVKRCRTNLPTKTVVVDYQDVTPQSIVDCIESLGFSATEFAPDASQGELDREAKGLLARLGVAGIGMMQVMMYALATYVAGDGGIEAAYEELMRWASLAIATPIALYSAMPFHRGALRDLQRLSPGMDVPVSLAILTAFGFSVFNVLTRQNEVYFDSVCMFTFLLLIGRYVELSSRRQYQDGVSLGESCLPAVALIATTNKTIAIDTVKVGDLIRVSPGEVIPVDGIVKQGISSVSEMAFTGESLPHTRSVGARVLAGSDNLDGELIVMVTVAYHEFVIKKMSDLYRESVLHKPVFSILADRVAQYFVAGILLLAFATGLFWFLAGDPNWFAITLTVLVVSCPCALSLATPVGYTVAITALRRNGVVVSTGEFLEKLAEVNRIVFDKTGTLTEGKLKIERVVLLSDTQQAEVLEICAALEGTGQHPIARAVSAKAASKTAVETTLKVTEACHVIGSGVQGNINGITYRFGKPGFVRHADLLAPDESGIWVLLAAQHLSAQEPIAWLNFSDEMRVNSVALVDRLRKRFELSMITGDSQGEAERIAILLQIEDVVHSATPQAKVEQIKKYQESGDTVLMVGDGVNDAAAMGIAHTSVAVSPVDIVVQEAAEATLLQNDIGMLDSLLIFSKRVRSIIRQNIFWAVGYNLCVVPMAVSGLLQPWMAALGMSMSSLLVVLNANRLRVVKRAEA